MKLQEGVALALEQVAREVRAAEEVALRQAQGDGPYLEARRLEGSRVTYRLAGHALVREDETGVHRVLPAPLQAVSWQLEAHDGLLWLTLTARHRPEGLARWSVYTATTAVALRNG